MVELKKEYFDIILKYIKLWCPNQRKVKYTDEYYLTNILDLLSDFTSWRSLKKSINYKNGFLAGKPEQIKKDNHFKTIHAKHVMWSKIGVYNLAYEEIIGKQLPNDGDALQLIIDATNIINKGGIDNVGYGTETKKKKFTKITVVSKDKNIVAAHLDNVKDKVITFNNKDTNIKTLEHDVNGIVPVIENVKNIISNSENYKNNSENKQINNKIILSGDK